MSLPIVTMMPAGVRAMDQDRFQLTELERRENPAPVVGLGGGTLTIVADVLGGRLDVFRDGSDIIIRSRGEFITSFAAADVTSIDITGSAASDIIKLDDAVTLLTTISGADDRDKIAAGGGPTTLNGDAGNDLVVGGNIANVFNPSPLDDVYKAMPGDTVLLGAGSLALGEKAIPPDPDTLGLPQEVMTAAEVEIILQRAAAASASSDAIIAITDRNGRILGVRVEGGVATEIISDASTLVFAIDGAVSLARTGAFFGNNQAPLTSRTVQFISQSTITEREVNSRPDDTNPDSTVRGPGYVAPVGIKGHFPPNTPQTPQVDLFGIEHTNRDGNWAVGDDRIKGTSDDVLLLERFNAMLIPGQELFAPESYGAESGVSPRTANGRPIAQSRGIATLPGGIPLYKNGQVVGGIGVFFPGKTGFATESNSILSTTYDATKADRTLEAEWIAFAAAGGVRTTIGIDPQPQLAVNGLEGIALPAGYGLPFGRIDLVGITLDVFGAGGTFDGPNNVLKVGGGVGRGNPNDGTNQVIVAGDPNLTRDGLPVSEGWLVAPTNGVGITAAEVERIILQGINEANETRAAIRLPLGSRAKMVFAVADLDGNIVGLYRMKDATVFSIDVAVAKARNTAYYADPTELQPIDQLSGIPAGTAFTNRTFRYLSEPRYPEGIDGAAPGPFSQLNDGGADPLTGRQIGAPLPASAYQSVLGYDSFNPGTNFRDPNNLINQNGIVFFPGSAPVYRGNALIGGFGVSGDGVDQDDVTTSGGQVGFGVPSSNFRADQVYFRGVRLPYQKFNRNPRG